MSINNRNNFASHYHFIGIGGVSMSCLAELLQYHGCIVSGSDQNHSDAVQRLQNKQIDVRIGHNAANLPASAGLVVVYNAAISNDNPEIIAAKQHGYKIISRTQLLGQLTAKHKNSICIAGTHGKTSTTSMAAEIFVNASKDPTVFSGGILPSLGGAMRIGGQEYFIAEACEYHNGFHELSPTAGVVLNIEMDHADYFKNVDEVLKSFNVFAKKIPKTGYLVISNSIDGLERVLDGVECGVITFGTEKDAYVCAKHISYNQFGCACFDAYAGDRAIGSFELSVPGEHNLQNALAAIATAFLYSIPNETIINSINSFTGAGRRFQHIGELGGARIIDDYAHHPTEVRKTLEAVKRAKHNRIWAIFQPHTNSRTKQFLDDFAQSLSIADIAIVLDIYEPAGREETDYFVHSNDIVSKMSNTNARYIASFNEAAVFIRQNVQAGDIVITMGAGDVYKLAYKLI